MYSWIVLKENLPSILLISAITQGFTFVSSRNIFFFLKGAVIFLGV